MKKLTVLTSCLALTACFGGGGNGVTSGGSMAPVRAAVDPTAVTSNANVTKMASEILVASGHTPELARSGRVHKNGIDYKSYRLDDVNFHVATGVDDAYLKFNLDEIGKIDSLVMNVGTGNQYMDRNGDTNMFRGIVYEYVVLDDSATQDGDPSKGDRDTLVRMVYSPANDISDYSVLSNAATNKCPAGKYCRWDRIDQAFRVSSQGTDFKYSDFGKLETDNFGKYKGITDDTTLANSKTQRTIAGSDGHITNDFVTSWEGLTFDRGYDTFAGGYNVNAVQHRPTTTMDFTGKAVGSLYATDSQNHADENLPLQDNAATLNFNTTTGKETLSMHFADWYDVTVEKDGTANSPKITFSNYTNTDTDLAENTSIQKQNYFKFRQDNGSGVVTNNFTTTQGDYAQVGHTQTRGLLDMGYYGINTTEEATGVVLYKETAKEAGGVQQEREFRAGYGLTPDAL